MRELGRLPARADDEAARTHVRARPERLRLLATNDANRASFRRRRLEVVNEACALPPWRPGFDHDLDFRMP